MNQRKWRPRIRPQDVRVGKYFVLSDFLYSHTAIAEGIPNVPIGYDGPEVRGMRGLCTHILDPVVEQFGPVSIAYGFCSPVLWRRSYGPNANLFDLHTFKPPRGGVGGAADIVIHSQKDPRPVMDWIKVNCTYDRLIIYPGSRIICVAWTEISPRFHAKEWLFGEDGGKAEYVNFGKPLPKSQHDKSFQQGSLFL
jgi:hypothetical protein